MACPVLELLLVPFDTQDRVQIAIAQHVAAVGLYEGTQDMKTAL
jgi:hypothetical protein